jgi:hypothetical protein
MMAKNEGEFRLRKDISWEILPTTRPNSLPGFRPERKFQAGSN